MESHTFFSLSYIYTISVKECKKRLSPSSNVNHVIEMCASVCLYVPSSYTSAEKWQPNLKEKDPKP